MTDRDMGDEVRAGQRLGTAALDPTPAPAAVAARAAGRIVPVKGTRNDYTRRHNLSALLCAVHYDGALTRAHLTKETGLNRSTIGGLVTELASLGLVQEDTVAETGMVGRPSLIVRPRADVVAITLHPDVDGIDLAVVGIDGEVATRRRIDLDAPPTAARAVEWAAAQVTEVLATMAGHRVVGIAVAIPALVSTDFSTVVRAPHLGWSDEAFGVALEEATGLPVAVGNDANLSLRAEWSFGAARGIENVVYLNGSSSGIGGAALVGGIMLRGARGYGGEFGHMAVGGSDEVCLCGRRGCLETVVSIERLERAAGIPRADLDATDLRTLATTRPELATELDGAAAALGHAIASLECAFDPSLVLLGGFLGALYDARADMIEEVVSTNAFRPEADQIAIERTALRDDLLAIGAAERAFAPVLRDPAGTALHVV